MTLHRDEIKGQNELKHSGFRLLFLGNSISGNGEEVYKNSNCYIIAHLIRTLRVELLVWIESTSVSLSLSADISHCQHMVVYAQETGPRNP